MTKLRRSAPLLLALYAALFSLWTWRLAVPHKSPASEADDARVAEVQKARESVAAYLAKAPQGTALPAMIQLVRMPDATALALAAWVAETPIRQLRQITVQQTAVSDLGREWREALLQTWLAHQKPVHLEDAHAIIAAAGDRIPDLARIEALQTLARRAQAQGDLPVAVTILSRACDIPAAPWETVAHLGTVCRNLRHPSPALRALKLWMQRHPQDSYAEEREDACNLELSLLLDAGQMAEAASLQFSRLTGSAPYPAASLERAFLAARQARQGSLLLPALERQLQTYPEHAIPPHQLAGKKDVSPDYRRWITCYASICDAEQPAPVAFAACLRLAALRDAAALPRLCALARNQAMEAEAGAALNWALDQPDTQKAVLQLAQTSPLARSALLERLRREPANRPLHFAAASAAATAASQTHTSAQPWQDYLRRFPDDHAARRRLAQAYVQDHQHAMALRTYDSFPPDALTAEDRHQQELLKHL